MAFIFIQKYLIFQYRGNLLIYQLKVSIFDLIGSIVPRREFAEDVSEVKDCTWWQISH